jgi:hypothetical protein
MFATYVNDYFLQMRFLDRSGNLAKFFMIMCFVVKLVYKKVVDKLCIYLLIKFGGIWSSSF